MSEGPIFFNTFPVYSVSLTDPNLKKVLTLNLQTVGFDLEIGTQNISLTYRIYMKIMTTLTPAAKQYSFKGLTTLLQANHRNNYITPKLLSWDEITRPEKWTLSQIVESKPCQQTEVKNIIETLDRDRN